MSFEKGACADLATVSNEAQVAISPRENALIKAGIGISLESAPPDDWAFTHSILCQVGLPRSRVDGREFFRQCGEAWINIQAGLLDEGRGPVVQCVPYGALPRLALASISTHAVRYKTREVPIGESASEYLRTLDMSAGGGPRGRLTTLRKQVHALAACRLQIGFKGRTFNGQPVEQFDAWISRGGQQRALWPGVVVLSEGYFKELLDHGVPLDRRALLALKGSALALDVYAWLAHRLHRIEGRPLILHWKAIRDQFAQEFQGKNAAKDFRTTFLIALGAALTVYPQAKVQQVTGGLMLKASSPPISGRT